MSAATLFCAAYAAWIVAAWARWCLAGRHTAPPTVRWIGWRVRRIPRWHGVLAARPLWSGAHIVGTATEVHVHLALVRQDPSGALVGCHGWCRVELVRTEVLN